MPVLFVCLCVCVVDKVGTSAGSSNIWTTPIGAKCCWQVKPPFYGLSIATNTDRQLLLSMVWSLLLVLGSRCCHCFFLPQQQEVHTVQFGLYSPHHHPLRWWCVGSVLFCFRGGGGGGGSIVFNSSLVFVLFALGVSEGGGIAFSSRLVFVLFAAPPSSLLPVHCVFLTDICTAEDQNLQSQLTWQF